MPSIDSVKSIAECARETPTINKPLLDPQKDALVVFAKIPIPGAVKTRLSPELTPSEAAQLYEAFLYDALDQYHKLGCSIRLYVAPDKERRLACVPEFVSEHQQSGSGLGDRMYRALFESSRRGFDRIVVIGTDHPTLPSDYVVQAFRSLGKPSDICLGPADDGGYYLMGLRKPSKQLFDGLAFSHRSVFTDTVRRVRELGLDLTILPSWYDVDNYAELTRLAGDLEAGCHETRRTEAVLDSLAESRPELALLLKRGSERTRTGKT